MFSIAFRDQTLETGVPWKYVTACLAAVQNKRQNDFQGF
jgi:hypothetical protein